MSDLRKISELTVDEFNVAVRAAVAGALKDAGLPIDDKEDLRAAQADFQHLRRWRKAVDGAATTMGRAIIMSVAASFTGLVMWLLSNFVVNK